MVISRHSVLRQLEGVKYYCKRL